MNTNVEKFERVLERYYWAIKEYSNTYVSCVHRPSGEKFYRYERVLFLEKLLRSFIANPTKKY